MNNHHKLPLKKLASQAHKSTKPNNYEESKGEYTSEKDSEMNENGSIAHEEDKNNLLDYSDQSDADQAEDQSLEADNESEVAESEQEVLEE